MDGLQENLSKLAFECPICLERAEDPRLLDCQHMVCFSCINAVYANANESIPRQPKQITCPVCIKITHFESLERLPCDFRANKIHDTLDTLQRLEKESRKKSDRKKVGHCEICPDKGATSEAGFYCFDCGKPFCHSCFKIHTKNPRFKEHVYCAVDETNIRNLICDQHDAYIQFFCVKCLVNVCEVCTYITHEEHCVKTFTIRENPDRDPDPFIQRKEQDIIKDFEIVSIAFEKHTQELQERIHRSKLAWIEALDEHEKSLLKVLADEENRLEQEIKTSKDELKDSIENNTNILRERYKTLMRPIQCLEHISVDDPDVGEIEAQIRSLYTASPNIPVCPSFMFVPSKVLVTVGTLTRAQSGSASYSDGAEKCTVASPKCVEVPVAESKEEGCFDDTCLSNSGSGLNTQHVDVKIDSEKYQLRPSWAHSKKMLKPLRPATVQPQEMHDGRTRNKQSWAETAKPSPHGPFFRKNMQPRKKKQNRPRSD